MHELILYSLRASRIQVGICGAVCPKPTAKYVHFEDTNTDYFQWSEHDYSDLLDISKHT